MQIFDVNRRRGIRLACVAENPCRGLQQLVTPLLPLVRVNIMGLRKLNQCLLSPDGFHCHLRLESRAVVPARSSAHCLLLARGNHAAVARKVHLSTLFRFLELSLSLLFRGLDRKPFH